MAFAAEDLVWRLTTGTAGTAGDAAASTPGASLGKYVSTTALPASLFDTITNAENRASTIDYRCVAVCNPTTVTMPAVKVHLPAQVTGGASVTIAVDPAAASAMDATVAQGAVVATETTAPAGIGSWSAPASDSTGVLVGDLPAGFCRFIWIKRQAADSPALAGDGATLAAACDQVD